MLSPTPPKLPPPAPAPRPYAALPLLWAALVLVLTLTPSDEMPRTPVWELLSFDTAAHAGVFFVLAGLSGFSMRRQRRWPWLAAHVGAVVLVGSLLFGALIEMLQMTMRLGRHGEWSDLLSDGLGAALAVGLAPVWAARIARRYPPVASVAALLLAAAALLPAPAQAQNQMRAKRTIKTLASSKMHGRGYVLQGEHLAAAYLRQRFEDLKLEPLAPSYTQPFALDVNTFPGGVAASIRAEGGGQGWGWPAGTACIAAPNSAAGNVKARLLLLDTLVFTQPTVRARYLRTAWPQRVLLLRAADAARLAQFPALRERLNNAAAWITVVPKLTASLAAEQAPQPRVEVLASKVPLWLDKAIFGDTATDTPKGRTVWATVRVGALLLRRYQTQNLAAVVRGTVRPDSFLVVSAHYDHLGMMGPHVYFPGANDNASGVALLLELAAHYARPENRPAYSVVFLLFGAEEAGLVGSEYFVKHPLVPLRRIKFLMNLDLLGTGEKGATVVNGRVFESAYHRLTALNDAHHYLSALGARGRAANSDHFPFSEAGVPAFFLYTRGGSAAYHDVNDRPKALSLVGFNGAYGLVRDFLNELGAAPAQR
ncbi:VanZ family protein [Hymenobacter sp. UYCo722]|uniref:VanZ family protein n=1 Tax=Hymenobacter sp. UYCo722 TaxID=3156335 RepID=UPI003391E502